MKNIGPRNKEGKFQAIKEMASRGAFTFGQYPTRGQFYRALEDGRVEGDYQQRIKIRDEALIQQYTFIKTPPAQGDLF